jgi:hypothetical protein
MLTADAGRQPLSAVAFGLVDPAGGAPPGGCVWASAAFPDAAFEAPAR